MEKIHDVDNEIMLVAVVVVDCRPLTCHSLAVARVNTGFAFTLALSMHCVVYQLGASDMRMQTHQTICMWKIKSIKNILW